MSRETIRLRRVLENLVNVVLHEAEHNPTFANRLSEALSTKTSTKKAAGAKPRKTPDEPSSKTSFDPFSLNPLALLVEHGPTQLQGELAKITKKTELMELVKLYNLGDREEMKKLSTGELRAAILAAATARKQGYDSAASPPPSDIVGKGGMRKPAKGLAVRKKS